MELWLEQLLQWLALPQHGLGTVFVVAFISATLLPMGSEPAVFGLVKLNPELFWPAIGVATAGNTLGGMLSWWMGWGTHQAVDRAVLLDQVVSGNFRFLAAQPLKRGLSGFHAGIVEHHHRNRQFALVPVGRGAFAVDQF